MNIYDLTLPDIEKYMNDIGEKPYRARQLFRHIYEGITIANMTDLSLPLRSRLLEDFEQFVPLIETKLVSKIDDTRKYLFKMSDGALIESVVMKYKHGLSICVSSQAGCKMGCAFCASTLHGLERNLTTGEITGQFIAAKNDLGERISNVVMMGSGEPFDNYENVYKFLQIATHPDGLGIGARHITISTCGIPDGIKKLSECKMQVNLSVSLHAPNDDIRKKIMPIARAVPINQLITECREYFNRTKRRVTYEYALIDGVNDKTEHAYELSELLNKDLAHVNLIPINYVSERGFKRSKCVMDFQKILNNNGINTTVRREMGADINAACGQLRNQSK